MTDEINIDMDSMPDDLSMALKLGNIGLFETAKIKFPNLQLRTDGMFNDVSISFNVYVSSPPSGVRSTD